jgi:hypothetical protein
MTKSVLDGIINRINQPDLSSALSVETLSWRLGQRVQTMLGRQNAILSGWHAGLRRRLSFKPGYALLGPNTNYRKRRFRARP